MRIAYYRVSTIGQTIDSQRASLGGNFDAEYADEGVSGTVPAMERPGFAQMFNTLKAGDVVCVYAIDRLGRDAIDVQTTAKALIQMGVILDVRGLGIISKGAGEIVPAASFGSPSREGGLLKPVGQMTGV